MVNFVLEVGLCPFLSFEVFFFYLIQSRLQQLNDFVVDPFLLSDQAKIQ